MVLVWWTTLKMSRRSALCGWPKPIDQADYPMCVIVNIRVMLKPLMLTWISISSQYAHLLVCKTWKVLNQGIHPSCWIRTALDCVTAIKVMMLASGVEGITRSRCKCRCTKVYDSKFPCILYGWSWTPKSISCWTHEFWWISMCWIHQKDFELGLCFLNLMKYLLWIV